MEVGVAGYAAADVSRPADVERVVAEAIAALGGLDCLVTNAGGRRPLLRKKPATATGILPTSSI